MGPDVLTSRLYGLDSYVDGGPAVSLLRYAEETEGFRIMLLIFPLQLLGAR